MQINNVTDAAALPRAMKKVLADFFAKNAETFGTTYNAKSLSDFQPPKAWSILDKHI